MPKPMDEDRARRKELLEQKRAARRAAKQEGAAATSTTSSVSSLTTKTTTTSTATTSSNKAVVDWLSLPEDAWQSIFALLPAVDWGRLTLTSRALALAVPEARGPYLLSRLSSPPASSSPQQHDATALQLCSTRAEAQRLLDRAYHGGGDTERLVVKGAWAKKTANEFIAYARFLEEAALGYATLDRRRRNVPPVRLPPFCQGRMASASPEHSLCRVGGDGARSGPGGSGLASWGVGRRGQLGHGKRLDQRYPRRVTGGLGYGLRIVQVSAGGGLVRVAHSLLLTATGRVLSFGTGQYGALGHGFSAAKQLPDMLRPTYIEALADVICVAVAAGELHSAAVTVDGDVYTWGDGFCGQLGHADKRPCVLPKLVTTGGLDEECISNITCGARHTVAISEEGEAFSWGLGHFGVLGRPFTPFDYDADAAVVALAGGPGAAGDHHEPEALAVVRAPAGPAAVPPPVVEDGDTHGPAMPGDERDLAAELRAHLDLIANLSLDDSSDQCIPKRIESLSGIKLVGACAGHRHTLLLDDQGALYSCGASNAGCLGHGDTQSQMYPVRLTYFDDQEGPIRIRQMSAGVDISMAVSVTGDVYAWGRTDGGRLGLGLPRGEVTLPRLVPVVDVTGQPVKAVDVECGYVHSLIIGLDGTLFMCGGVGVDGDADGQEEDEDLHATVGLPRPMDDFNIWHRTPEPKEETVKKERWKKFGKYEVRGRSKMLNENFDQAF